MTQGYKPGDAFLNASQNMEPGSKGLAVFINADGSSVVVQSDDDVTDCLGRLVKHWLDGYYAQHDYPSKVKVAKALDAVVGQWVNEWMEE